MILKDNFDFLIVGASVVGLAIAKSIKRRFPDASVCLLEKDSHLGAHSSCRNSGVIMGVLLLC